MRSKNKVLARSANFAWIFIRICIVAGTAYYILLPFFTKISVAFMSREDLYDTTVRLVPRNFSLETYRRVIEFMDYYSALLNTFGLSLLVTVLQLASCLLVGYGLARFTFPFKRLLFMLVILTLIIPPHIIIIPSFLNFRFFDFFGLINLTTGNTLNLTGSIWPFILNGSMAMGLRNGLYIFVARQFFRNVPKELEDAALIDGASPFKTFLAVMVPIAKPIMTIIIILSFAWQWTDVFYTTWYFSSANLLARRLDTLADVIAVYDARAEGLLIGALDINYMTQINGAGSIVVLAPLVVFYLFVQRQFIESVDRAGIVG